MATIVGTSGNDKLIGTGADDILYGMEGNDALIGGAGNDLLYGYYGYDTLVGGAGNDWLFGGAGPVRAFGGAGEDGLHGGDSDDLLEGGSGADSLYGGWGTDTLLGGGGADVLQWFYSSDDETTDRVSGDGGIDRLEVWTSTRTTTLDLRAVADDILSDIEIVDLRYTDATLVLTEADLLDISSTTDRLEVLGDANSSVSIVGAFEDLGVSGAFHRYKIGAGMLLVDTDIPQMYGTNVISGSGWNDTLDGTAGDDLFTGHGGSDLVNAADGNDTLNGSAGVDTLNGGDGDDTYIMRATAPTEVNSRTFWDGDVVSDTGGNDTLIFIHQGGTMPDGIENLVLRGGGVSTWWSRFGASGNDLDNLIRSERSGGAAPLLNGGGGDDTLIGSNHHDDYFGFSGPAGDYGHDFVDGRGGIDWLEVSYASVVDFRSGTVTSEDEFGSGSVTFINIERAKGGGGADLIIANDAGLIAEGRDGDDTLIGGAGDDYLDGEGYRDNGYYFSNDRLIGGAGADTLLGGGYSDYLSGGSGADFLDGGGYYADILLGGGGNDTLIWDPNDTRISGGRGADVLRTNWDFDLTEIDNSLIEDIEIIELRDNSVYSAYHQKLTLTEADLLDLSSATDTVKVLGGRGDSVDIVGPFEDLGISGRFHEYKLGAGTLLVHTNITDVG